MSSKIPTGVHHHADTKKTSKDTATVSSAVNTNAKSDGILKPQKENMLRKNTTTKVTKGISSRYGQQAELRDQNQHLMAANEELQNNLAEAQHRVVELELQFSGLETENAEVRKQLKDCHVLLTTAKIDPVLGEKVGEAAQQNEDQRKEVMRVSTVLLHELRAFGETASQQRAQLEAMQTTMAELTKAKERMMQERENFSLEAAEIEKALKEAEALIM